ncbi:uncharacterized protein LOC125031778 [Penaeus chinensis]|nr:uncharacterized protein LOC125031778 [Penaeus chinensis]
MLLFKHTVILCLLGVVHCHGPVSFVREPSPMAMVPRSLKIEDIERFGAMANEAASVIEKLTGMLHLIADPSEVPELREGLLGEKIRASIETGKAFVRLIETINAALEPYVTEERR